MGCCMPSKVGGLEEFTGVLFFKGDKASRNRVRRLFPGRWSNDSHFVRAAVQHFMKSLERESRTKRRSVKV